MTLSGQASGNADVNYATSDGTARAGSDYTAKSGTLTIAAGSTTGTITVVVSGDTVFETNETLTMTLSSPSANVTLGTATATGTITNDDTAYMNDTGITKWGNGSVSNLTVTQAAFPVQDADVGRDSKAALNSNSDGKAGFSFTKLDSSGVSLANQTAVYSTTPWDCVQDNVTGLMWEVKTTSGLRSKSHTYTWYNSTGVNDGGNAGTANGGICFDTTNCDTEKYVAAVNAVGLCGYSDWRLPATEELRSIADESIASSSLKSIDTEYFPNTTSSIYWSSSPSAGSSSNAGVFTYASLSSGGAINKSLASASGTPICIRLVRDGS